MSAILPEYVLFNEGMDNATDDLRESRGIKKHHLTYSPTKIVQY